MKSAEIRHGIRNSRESDYGPFRRHFKATGMAWGGIYLQLGLKPGDPVPARAVGLFFAADKLMREAYKHKGDNVDDGTNYLQMSGEAAEDVQAHALELRGWSGTDTGIPAVHVSPVSTEHGQGPELNAHVRHKGDTPVVVPADPQRVDVVACANCHSKIRGEK